MKHLKLKTDKTIAGGSAKRRTTLKCGVIRDILQGLKTKLREAVKMAGFHEIPAERFQDFVKPEEMEYEDNVVLIKEYTHKICHQATQSVLFKTRR